MVREVITTDRVDSWRHRRWVYQNATLQEVALQLEESFGYPVRWEEDSLKTRRVTGIVPTDNLGIVLQALSLSLDLHISKKNNTILIAR